MGNILSYKENKLNLELEARNAELVNLISSGELTTIDEIAARYNLSFEQASMLLSDPRIQLAIVNVNKSKALLLSIKVPTILGDILSNGENTEKLSAIKIIGQMTDQIKKSGGDVNLNNINISLESRLKQSTKETPDHLSQVIDLVRENLE